MIRSYFILLILTLHLPLWLFGQTTPADYFFQAELSFEDQHYDSAIVFMDFSIDGYKNEQKYDTLMEAYGAKAQYILMRDGAGASIDFLNQIVEIGAAYFPKFHNAWLDIYYQYANAYEVNGDLKSGSEYIDKILELIDEVEVPLSKKARSYAMAARIYHGVRKHKEGIRYGKMARDLFLEAYPDTTRSYYATLNTLAAIYLFNSQYDSSIVYSLQSLRGTKKNYGNDHFNVGAGYNQIASIHYNLNRYVEAIEYFSKAEDIFQNYFEKTGQDVFVNIIRTNLSLVYIDMNEFELALEYVLNVWPADLRNYGPNSPKLLYTLGRLVTIYHGNNDLLSAQKYINYLEGILASNPDMTASNKCYALNFILDHKVRKNDLEGAKHIFNQYSYYYDESGEEINKTYVAAISELANVYSNVGIQDTAAALYEDALNAYRKMFPRQNNAIFKAYLNISENLADKDPIRASQYLDSALINRIYPEQFVSFSEAIEHCEPSPLTIESVKLKLRLLAEHGAHFENNSGLIRQIVAAYDEYIESYVMIIRSQGRINDLAEDNDQVYSFAIKNLLNQGDIEQAFTYAEKNRALSIRLALNQNKPIKYADIPERVLSRELKIITEINHQNIVKNNFAISDSARSVARMEYNDALNRYIFLLDEIRQAHPAYYELKYSLPKLKISDIQKKLDSKTCVLSYKYLENNLRVFMLTKNEIDCITLDAVNLDEELRLLTSELNKGILVDSIATSIYNKLWKPIEGKLPFEIIIVPDRMIHYLSFELLKDQNDRFLIEDYEISYTIAADLTFKKGVPVKNSDWLAFAPGFHDTLKQNYVAGKPDRFDSAYINYLQQPWTIDFTSELRKSGSAIVYQASEASENNFKLKSIDAPLIFIGTHAEIDDKQPNYSKLVFAKPKENEVFEDGYLHTYEIYGNPLNTELAILTACNTGIGPVRNGEGILSLSRSFAFAGCPSIVMTKWSVDEFTSIEIAKSFIINLKKGQPKNEALRKAKLTFINDNPAYKNNPYYWAGMTLIGDPTPIYSSNKMRWYFIAAGIILFVLAFYTAYRHIYKSAVK